MKRTQRALFLVATLFSIAAVFLSGCGSAPASPTTAPAKATAPSATTAQAATSAATSAAPAAPTAAPAAPTAAPAVATAPTAAPAPPKAVQPTGELKVGVGTFGGSVMDPQVMTNPMARSISAAIFDQLVGVAPDGRPGPGLAEKWDMSPDGKAWTFYLRKGVKFHDGSDLTGEDVKFTMERYMAEGSSAPDVAALRAGIDRIELKDPYTVVMNLKAPDGEWWRWFMLPVGEEGQIMPKKYIEAKGVPYFRENPVGSGPWKVLSFKPNTELVLEAVTGHWRKTPAFKTLRILVIPELSTRLTMLKTGELDVAEASPEVAKDIKAQGLRAIQIPNSRQASYTPWPDYGNPPKSLPLNDVRVRKALSLAINRQELAETLFAGYATPSAMLSMPPSSLYFDASQLKPDPFDLDQARKLLADAGQSKGFSFSIYATGISTWSNSVTQALTGYWQKLGVDAKVITVEYASHRPKINPVVADEMKGNATALVTPALPNFGLKTYFSFGKGFIKSTSIPELDALIDKTEATPDPTERKKLALQAALMAKNAYTYVPVLDMSDILAVGKKVGDWKGLPGGYMLALEFENIPHAQ